MKATIPDGTRALELYRDAIKAVKKYKLHFHEDVRAYLGISAKTYSKYLRPGSDYYEDIRQALETNRVKTKHHMRLKWEKSDNSSLQLAVMRLIGTNRDRSRLSSGNNTDLTSGGKPLQINIDATGFGQPVEPIPDV